MSTNHKPIEVWQPSAPLRNLHLRAHILAEIRQFFAARAVLEVETPVLCAAAATAPHLDSLVTRCSGPFAPRGRDFYLHTSPEFAMKRLVAAGSGPIYQICKVFRDGEAGRRHNPEFTMLEWYRPGLDEHALMDEVAALVAPLLAALLSAPSQRISYGAAFQRHAGIDVHGAAAHDLRACAVQHHIGAVAGLAPDDCAAWQDLLLTHVVAPKLGVGGLCFLYDYPAQQAALARVTPSALGCPGGYPVARRFELYVNGMELASGYHELADAHQQRQRFADDNAHRARLGKPALPCDEHLLAALAAGLPDCAGVALGVDRLVMLAAGARDLSEVVAFPIERA